MIVLENDRISKWMTEKSGAQYRLGHYIGCEKNGQLIAGVCYDWFQGPINVSFVSEGKYWLTREFLWFCCHYPFEQLKAKTIIGFVREDNFKSRTFTEHLGAKIIANVDGHLIYGMNKDQCKWLNLKVKNGTRTNTAAYA